MREPCFSNQKLKKWSCIILKSSKFLKKHPKTKIQDFHYICMLIHWRLLRLRRRWQRRRRRRGSQSYSCGSMLCIFFGQDSFQDSSYQTSSGRWWSSDNKSSGISWTCEWWTWVRRGMMMMKVIRNINSQRRWIHHTTAWTHLWSKWRWRHCHCSMTWGLK